MQQRPWLQAFWDHLIQDELLRDPRQPKLVRYRPTLEGPNAFEIPMWKGLWWSGLILAALSTVAFVVMLINALRQGPLFS